MRRDNEIRMSCRITVLYILWLALPQLIFVRFVDLVRKPLVVTH